MCVPDEREIVAKLMQGTEDRNALLGTLVGGDRWAAAALERGDDLALLRRIVKAGIFDAVQLAVERAWMRGGDHWEIARAIGEDAETFQPRIAAIYGRLNA